MSLSQSGPKEEAEPNFLALLGKIWIRIHRALLKISFFPVSITLALAIWVKYWAESNLLTVFLAYLPPWVLVAPLLGCVLAGVVFWNWRCIVLCSGVMVILPLWLGGYQIFRSSSPEANPAVKTISVMTYNRGQGSWPTAVKLADEMLPDIITLQESGRRAIPELPAFTRLPHRVTKGEFVILSRWRVVSSELLLIGEPKIARYAAAKFVLDVEGQDISVYSAHLPTPRDVLFWYGSRGTFLYGVVGLVPLTDLHARHEQYLKYWAERVAWSEDLARIVKQDHRPVLLMGDLNTPPLGMGYKKVTENLSDSHFLAGDGFGFTFPGTKSRWRGLFSPWLRIDYLLISKHWRVIDTKIGGSDGSQHLPLSGKLELRSGVY